MSYKFGKKCCTMCCSSSICLILCCFLDLLFNNCVMLDFYAVACENSGMNRVGRPTKYTDAFADEICHRMSEGENLNPILRSLDITRASFTRWVDADYKHVDGEGFRIKYTRARKQYIDYMLDHVMEIPYDTSGDTLEDADGKRHGNHARVQRHRLQVDTIKWIACKVVPKMPSLQGTLGEIARNIVRGVEKEGLPTEQAEKMMNLLEAAANIKKIDEFEDAIKTIPLLKSKITEFERLRSEQVRGDL